MLAILALAQSIIVPWMALGQGNQPSPPPTGAGAVQSQSREDQARTSSGSQGTTGSHSARALRLSIAEAWRRNEELQEVRRKVKQDPYYPQFQGLHPGSFELERALDTALGAPYLRQG